MLKSDVVSTHFISVKRHGRGVDYGFEWYMAYLNVIHLLQATISFILCFATATASQANASYQWIDCATNQAVAGATSRSFTTANTGSYKVVISLNGCSDTSDCINLMPTGIKEIDWSKTISISPNPASDLVTISFHSLNATHAHIDILDVEGRIVFQSDEKVSSGKCETTIDLRNVTKGIYIIRVNAGDNVGVRKLVIQ